jgi:hypothetical protein
MMQKTKDALKSQIHDKYIKMSGLLNERSKRIWAASEAEALPYGGITLVSAATNLSRERIHAGIKEIKEGRHTQNTERIRMFGGGRKTLTYHDDTLKTDLQAIIEPSERGDPEQSLRWSSKSAYQLTDALKKKGHTISPSSVHTLLRQEGYSLQSNRKRMEGNANHPDRDAQFNYINESVKVQQAKGEPCVSIDTKKKDNVGNYKNNGQEWSKKGEPVDVNMHDFTDKKTGKAIPRGIYDLITGKGWVTVGIDHDTAAFAVASIKKWWKRMGKKRYPNATELLITADGGGSNNHRSRLFKAELQKFANALKLAIKVRHFPPGTSKWNKIEHRLFSMISKNWRGKPLVSLATIVNLIAATTTTTGLTVTAVIDDGEYPIGLKVSDEEFAALNLMRDDFHGEWNYTIYPRDG